MTRRRFDRPDDDIPPERFARGSAADWPEPAREPEWERDHPDRMPDGTKGPY